MVAEDRAEQLLLENEALRARLDSIEAFVTRLREDPVIRSIENGQFTLSAPLRIVAPGVEYGVVRTAGGHLVTVPLATVQSAWSDA